MRELSVFLGSAIVISLSGVLQPGALTAATVSAAARRRWAGAWVAIGHGVVELPLMLLVVQWADRLSDPRVGAAIGAVGGAFLLWMAWGSFRNAARPSEQAAGETTRHPLAIGVVMSGCNPYFLGWWLTVGLGLAQEAGSLGRVAFAVFAGVHWSLDLIWLTALAWTAHKGGKVWGAKVQRVVMAMCGAALVFFGGKFIYDAGVGAYGLLSGG